MSDYPILYSFRRCPYAMRARLALVACNVVVELREVHLRNKPDNMLQASPKGTVPVLVLQDKTVIDESLDIMNWALEQNDTGGWLADFSPYQHEQFDKLISENDSVFKQHLDHYKYADRFVEFSAEHYRHQGEMFLKKLDELLQHAPYLFGSSISIADVAIFPFIRQFAHVDKDWFDNCQYHALQAWLGSFLVSPDFIIAMKKYAVWQPGDKKVLFPG